MPPSDSGFTRVPYSLNFRVNEADAGMLSRMKINWKPVISSEPIKERATREDSDPAISAWLSDFDAATFACINSMLSDVYHPPKNVKKPKAKPRMYVINSCRNERRPDQAEPKILVLRRTYG